MHDPMPPLRRRHRSRENGNGRLRAGPLPTPLPGRGQRRGQWSRCQTTFFVVFFERSL